MRLTALGDLANRYGVQTPAQYWVDLFTDIQRITDYDGDWQQMVEERIAGLSEMRERYYEIAAKMDGEAGVEWMLPWSGDIAFEGLWTSDGRMIEPGALVWPNLPLILMSGGEPEGQACGSIIRIERDDRDVDGNLLPEGVTAIRGHGHSTLDQRRRHFVAIDLQIQESEAEIENDKIVIKSAQIMGATICFTPAFQAAVVVPGGEDA